MGQPKPHTTPGLQTPQGPVLRRRVFLLLQRSDNHTEMATRCAKVPPVGAGISAAFTDDFTTHGGVKVSPTPGGPVAGVVDNALPE